MIEGIKNFVKKNKFFATMILSAVFSIFLSKTQEYLDYSNTKKKNYNIDQNNVIFFASRKDIPSIEKKPLSFLISSVEGSDGQDYKSTNQDLSSYFTNCSIKSNQYFSNGLKICVSMKIDENFAISSVILNSCESQDRILCNNMFTNVTKLFSECNDIASVQNVEKFYKSEIMQACVQ